MRLRAALLQTRTPSSQAAALEQLLPMIDQAAAQGAEIILTPEGSNFLQRRRELLERTIVEEDDDLAIAAVRSAAARLSIPILLGSALVRRPDGLFANRSLLFGRSGERLAAYDKIHMFDVDLPTGERHRESALYAPGGKAVVAELDGVRIGMTICYDVRFPELYRALASAGAAILTAPSAFTRPTGEAHWEVLLRARAIENGAFVLAPAQGGSHEDGRSTWGHSMAVSPWGEVLASAAGDEPGVILADLDLGLVEKARSAIPSLANGREFSPPG